MAFVLVASAGETSTILNDGNPFSLERAEGLGGSGVVRLEQNAPLQNGATDTGYRLEPRTVVLHLSFRADTDAELDARRDRLFATFQPQDDSPIALQVTRDDGETRTLTCYTVGNIVINLAPEYRPGHAHRASVWLRASDPLWAGSTTREIVNPGAWWLAGGMIDESQVLAHVENPAFDDWSIGSAIPNNWAVSIVTSRQGSPAFGQTSPTAWADDTDFMRGAFLRGPKSSSLPSGTLHYDYNFTQTDVLWAGPTHGANHHTIAVRNGNEWWAGLNGTAHRYYLLGSGNPMALGSTGSWRHSNYQGIFNSRWEPTISRAMIWTDPTDEQIRALTPYIMGSVTSESVVIVNNGDAPAYPLIELHGPITDPVVKNETTGHSIDLTGITLGNADVLYIDLRDGDKKIYNSDRQTELGNTTALPVGIGDFAIAPAVLNTISIGESGSVGNAATFAIEFTERHMSF